MILGRLSLRYRIALVIFALEALVLASVLGLTLGQSRRVAFEFDRASNAASFDMLSALSVSALLTSEYSDFQLYLQEAEKQPSLDRIVLADRNGLVVADSQRSGVGHAFDEVVLRSDKGWEARPVDSAAGALGTLAVRFSTEALSIAYRNTLAVAVAMAVAGMALIALVGVASGAALTRRLERVTAAVERFAAGDPTARSGVAGSDEVALLSRTFDAMASTVAEQQRRVADATAELARLNQSLEAQVAERTADLLEAKAVAERASRAKTDFLASMSHEIRTPMNAILGLSYLALQSGLDARQANYVRKAHDAAEHLLGILNGILDFAKVEAGKVQLEKEEFALAEVLERVMQTVGVKARTKHLDLQVEVAPAVPQRLIGDALRLGQVLLNLCDNAVKFTERGGVHVQVENLSRQGAEVELLFAVSDTGRGIAAAQQDAIFEEFTQADASTTREHGGSGLGLAIVRKLVELMGGIAGVSSQVDSGSTFHFTARFGLAPDERPHAHEADASQQGRVERDALLRGAKVLLAEDNEVNRIVARELLERAGIEVVVAGNGREALALLTEHRDVDVVLMDCQMPVMDGFAATRAIRFDRRLAKLPVLAMTANVLPDDLASCRGAGMNDHIGKPFKPAELYATLARWVEHRGRRTRLEHRAEAEGPMVAEAGAGAQEGAARS